MDCLTHPADGWHCRIMRRHEAHAASVPVVMTEQPLPQASPWWKVALCEEGGRNDATFGYLGILPSTWTDSAYDGLRFAPGPGQATWVQQVTIATEIMGAVVPDQNGCWPNGW